MLSKNKYKILSLFLGIQLLLVQLIARYPSFIEIYYSKGLYLYLSRFFRILFGWIPFSIGDILYLILGYLIIKSIYKSFKNRKINFLKIISFFSIMYCCFHFFWGFNYYRLPLFKTLNIEKIEYSPSDLEEFANLLIGKINDIQVKITKEDSLKVTIPYSKKQIYKKAQNGYTHLANIYPQFEYKTTSIKNSLISIPMTYLGTSGYLNPFTNEAQVNSLNPLINYPATTCHEMAHQIGFAAENEANFVGFLVSIHNQDLYFQFSGYYMALRYILNELYRLDKVKYKLIFEKINKGIIKNMIESQKFWQSYQNPIEPYTKRMFDVFLKVNKQTEGINSYNLMVGMLINYNKQYPNMLKLLN